jgi:hypothetical protein
VNELYWSPKKTALSVDFLDPYFHRQQRGFAVRSERTGFRNAKTDLDRLLVLSVSCHDCAKGGDNAKQAGKSRSFQISKHGPSRTNYDFENF